MKTQSKYMVCNENTLCYSQAEFGSNELGILAGKPQIGGRSWTEGTFVAAANDVFRPATKADFDYFRVCSKGYFA